MRLFIAIPVPESLRTTASRVMADLQAQGIVGAWVPARNLHLTLTFLGQVDSASLPKVEQVCTSVVKGITRFSLTLGQVTCIPARAPQVLICGVAPTSSWVKLQHKLHVELKRAGFNPSSKPPHLTLVRLKRPLKPTVCFRAVAPHAWEVSTLQVVESHLTPAGSVYKVLKALKLPPKQPQGRLRPNVAICLINPKKEVLLVKHREHVQDYWQFPQGGIKAGDSIARTVTRELAEELGLHTSRLLLVREDIYHYHWPRKLIEQGSDPEKQGYVGQTQSLAIVRVGELRPHLKPDPREAAEVRWFRAQDVLRALNPIRRTLGRMAMLELRKLESNPST